MHEVPASPRPLGGLDGPARETGRTLPLRFLPPHFLGAHLEVVRRILGDAADR